MTGEAALSASATPPALPGLAWRPYAPGDLADVVDLHVRAFAILGREHHSDAQIAGHAALIRAAGYADDLDRSHLTLAFVDDVLVATAGWLRMSDAPQTARIRKVFVAPAVARRGLATWLVRNAEAEAVAHGCARYFVRANLNAVPLYERLGYGAVEYGGMDTPTGATLPVLFMRKP